ncbi:unnamed protein product [Rhizoctonia solani]|uniref:Ammonium transporter AmtB-like domain-containing protein n=1 Tax=Rhizoctonia solani TaxID=456999 RepID=A0A8H3GHA5_9AGAM|nr:unnamed protein product [Rhizoctonia solani]
MPNITYSVSNDIEWYDAATGDTIVYNLGDIAWVLTCTALVWIMIPGVGFFYSGLLRRKNALSMIYFSMMALAVVSFQWFFWGYSLAFSDGASAFIGDLKYFALKGVLDQPSMGSTRIPALVFSVYQLMFAAITPMLALGGFAERCRLGPVAVFVFVWSTLVYDPIACWTWNAAGWSYVLGGLDFAGGTPVHISSGTAALAISIYLGKRSGYGTERLAYKPHNTTYVVLAGTLCNFATQLKFVLHYDECLDVFACHGVGGIVGNLLTGLFAQAYIAGLDPPSQIVPSDEPSKIAAGWLNRHYIQLAYQIADSAAGFAYSFIMTTLILWVFHFIPFLRLRTSEEAETVGIDENDMGESAYDFNTGQERGSTELNGVPSPPGPPLVIE